MTWAACEQLIRNQQVSGSNPLVGSSQTPRDRGFFVLWHRPWAGSNEAGGFWRAIRYHL
jgi:hypothetical protein